MTCRICGVQCGDHEVCGPECYEEYLLAQEEYAAWSACLALTEPEEPYFNENFGSKGNI